MHGAIKDWMIYFREERHADNFDKTQIQWDLGDISYGVLYKTLQKSFFPIKNHGLLFINRASHYFPNFESKTNVDCAAIHIYYDESTDDWELNKNSVIPMKLRNEYLLPVTIRTR